MSHPMLSVLAAISGVMHDISETGIGKNRQNTEQKYSFRGIDDVFNKLSPLYVKHGLIIVPRVLKRELVPSQTKSGGALWKVTVEVEYDVYSKDGSKLEPPPRTFGEAMDSADKATNKALSAAYKYLAIQLFAIPVEGQPDADDDTPEPIPVINAAQVAEIERLLKARGADRDELLAYLSGKAGYEIKSLAEVPVAAFEGVVKNLSKPKKGAPE